MSYDDLLKMNLYRVFISSLGVDILPDRRARS